MALEMWLCRHHGLHPDEAGARSCTDLHNEEPCRACGSTGRNPFDRTEPCRSCGGRGFTNG